MSFYLRRPPAKKYLETVTSELRSARRSLAQIRRFIAKPLCESEGRSSIRGLGMIWLGWGARYVADNDGDVARRILRFGSNLSWSGDGFKRSSVNELLRHHRE